MKERFLRLMGGKSSAVTFGTFHAVFFMILKHAYQYQAENIIREEQRVSGMREIIKRHRLESVSYTHLDVYKRQERIRRK